MKSPVFWKECIEHGLDPLWAYRYLRWRLGHPKHASWRLTNEIPGHKLCVDTIMDYIRSEWIEGEDDGVSLEQELQYYA